MLQRYQIAVHQEDSPTPSPVISESIVSKAEKNKREIVESSEGERVKKIKFVWTKELINDN